MCVFVCIFALQVCEMSQKSGTELDGFNHCQPATASLCRSASAILIATTAALVGASGYCVQFVFSVWCNKRLTVCTSQHGC